jgi:hypothetical protein
MAFPLPFAAAHNRAEFVARPRTVGLQVNYSFEEH